MEYKLIVLGDSGAGKSALTIQFCSDHFITEWDPNIEDSYRKRVAIDGDAMLLQILDSCSSSFDLYAPLRTGYMKESNGFVLVYSVLSRESFHRIKEFVDEIFTLKGDDAAIVICCNKSDFPKSQWEIDLDEGKQFALKYDIPFFLTSAKTKLNVRESIFQCVREIKKHRNPMPTKGKRELCLTRKRKSDFVDVHVKPVFSLSDSTLVSDFKKMLENPKFTDIVLETEDGSSIPAHSIIVTQNDIPRKFPDLATLNNFLQSAYIPNKEMLSTCVNQSKFSDITFKLTDGHVFAHKVILAARCPYFNSMFSSSMIESKQSIFEVENVSVSSFLLFIEYLYTDSVPEVVALETLQSVLVLANQYNVTRLCEICEQKISNYVTHSNAVDILLFAEILGTVPTLSNYAMYIIHSEIAILLLTGGLLDLPPELRKEAIKHKIPYKFQGTVTLNSINRKGIGILPSFLVSHVFSFLNERDLNKVGLVCYDWRYISNICWESRVKKQGWLPETDSWKNYYSYRSSLERNWELGKYVKNVLSGHTGSVSSLSLEGDVLVSGSWDKTVRVWDLSGKSSVKVLEHSSDVQCVLLRDNLIVSGGSDTVVQLWDMSGFKIASYEGHKSAIKSIDREISTVVTGSDDTCVKLWDVETSSLLVALNGHKKGVWSVLLSGSTVYSGDDQCLKVWDVRSGKEVHHWTYSVTSMKKQGEKLIVASHEHVLEVDTCGKLGGEWRGYHGDSMVTCVDIYENRMASGGFDSKVRTFDLLGNKGFPVLEHPKPVRSLQMDETRMITGCYDKNIYVFDYSHVDVKEKVKYPVVKNKNCTVQ